MNLGPIQILAPLLLLGMLAAAIPVLLHLLAKVRAPQVYFPTLRFLRVAMEKTARRRRVQHWLLLLLRMVALALLALAVAQPLIRASARRLGGDNETAVAIVLDNSASMQVRDSGRTRFDAARQEVIDLLRDRNFPRAVVIVTNGEPARDLPDAMSTPAQVVTSLDEQKTPPGSGKADLSAAIARAQELLANDPAPNKEIYLFSDLQTASTTRLRDLPLPEKLRAAPPSILAITPAMPAESAGPVNLAITGIELNQPSLMAGRKIFVDVAVRNYSPLGQEVRVNFFLDGQNDFTREQPYDQQQDRLAGTGKEGSTRQFRFAFTPDTPGYHHGIFQLQRRLSDQADAWGTDDLEADNRRAFAVDVADRVDALLLKPREELDRSLDAGYLLRQLCGLRLSQNVAQAIRLRERTPADMDGLDAELADAEVLITCDMPLAAAGEAPAAGLSPGQVAAIRRFVADGGTWMIWLGPTMDLDACNRQLGPQSDGSPSLLGGVLARYVGQASGGTATEGEPVHIQAVDLEHPMFRDVYPPGAMEPYRKVLVFRHALLQRDPAQPGRVLAMLNTGDPLVVETPLGRGRVLLFTTSSLPAWSTWLRQPQAFAIYQMLLASARGRTAPTIHEYREDGRVEFASLVPHPDAVADMQVSITPPGGGEITAEPPPDSKDKSAGPVFTALDHLGVYRWRVINGANKDATGEFVVNVPAEESDLRRLGQDAPASGGVSPIDAAQQEFESQIPGDRPVLVGQSMKELLAKVEKFRKGSPIWPWLLAIVLVLLAVEAKLANRSRPAEGPGLRPALSLDDSPTAPAQPDAS
ncbi:MAG: hypothetical protein BIFFINMI_04041 [Phycisphaerae bacterium]|nr:hypothetical protein [Phycisphaerae bacterium]